MRVALRSLTLIWATVSAVSLLGLICVLPGYSIDGAFSEALRKHPSPQASFWFHWCTPSSRGRLYDSVVVPYIPQALRKTAEIKLTASLLVR
jgi:hypothetical protein